jgi:hypothetical protein
MEISFRRFLEVGTGTGDIASYARPVLPMVTRQFLGPWASEDPFFKKKKFGKEAVDRLLKRRGESRSNPPSWLV